MNNIFLSPHSDDEVLFGAYTIMKYKPSVVVCTDSYLQGENLIERRNETRDAMDILGVEVFFLGIPDMFVDKDFRTALKVKLERLEIKGTVYAPNIDCSNRHHKIVGEVAQEIFNDLVFYDTYKDSWGTTGIGVRVPYSPAMALLKEKAMIVYKSQLEREQTVKHFEIWDEYLTN